MKHHASENYIDIPTEKKVVNNNNTRYNNIHKASAKHIITEFNAADMEETINTHPVAL